MTKYDMERVASLAGHPGFQGLLKLLDEADEQLLRTLEKATGEAESAALSLWRASRRFRRLIENTPANLVNELGMNVDDRF